MPLSSKERAALRAEANALSASVHLGQHGFSESVRQTIDDALRTHELVKIQFGKNADIDMRDAATEVAVALGADVVQVIGKTATIYRENPELKGNKDNIPPWR